MRRLLSVFFLLFWFSVNAHAAQVLCSSYQNKTDCEAATSGGVDGTVLLSQCSWIGTECKNFSLVTGCSTANTLSDCEGLRGCGWYNGKCHSYNSTCSENKTEESCEAAYAAGENCGWNGDGNQYMKGCYVAYPKETNSCTLGAEIECKEGEVLTQGVVSWVGCVPCAVGYHNSRKGSFTLACNAAGNEWSCNGGTCYDGKYTTCEYEWLAPKKITFYSKVGESTLKEICITGTSHYREPNVEDNECPVNADGEYSSGLGTKLDVSSPDTSLKLKKTGYEAQYFYKDESGKFQQIADIVSYLKDYDNVSPSVFVSWNPKKYCVKYAGSCWGVIYCDYGQDCDVTTASFSGGLKCYESEERRFISGWEIEGVDKLYVAGDRLPNILDEGKEYTSKPEGCDVPGIELTGKDEPCKTGFYCPGSSTDWTANKCLAGATTEEGGAASETGCYLSNDTEFCDKDGNNCFSLDFSSKVKVYRAPQTTSNK